MIFAMRFNMNLSIIVLCFCTICDCLERRYICDICGAGLKRKEHLERHKLGHSPERPHICSVCKKGFKRKEHLNLHFVIHSGDKTEVCNFSATQSNFNELSMVICLLLNDFSFRFVESVVRVSTERITCASIQNLIKQNGSKRK